GILYVTAKLSLLVETIGADEYSEYWSSLIHMGPIFEPAVTAYLSKSAVAVNLLSQYGGIVEFARPFLGAASGDPIGLFWFAFFALATSMLCIWLAARRLLSGNSTLALITTAGVIYLTGMKSQQFACFQCTNFRWFWPSLFLLFASFNIHQRPGWRWLPYLLFPIAIYWNPETGLAALAAWLGWQLIANLGSLVTGQIQLHWASTITAAFLRGALSFVAGVSLLVSYLYYKSNAIPDFSLLFQYARDFYQLGFGMIAMPAFHLWNIYVLLAITLFSSAIQHYLTSPERTNQAASQNCDFIVFSTLLFGLLFAYYQGRSHYTCLLSISYPLGLALIAWLGTGSPTSDSGKHLPSLRMPQQGLLLAVLSLSAAAFAITPYYLPTAAAWYRQDDHEGKRALIAFIQRTADGKRPLFISFSAWRLALLSRQSAGATITPLAAMFRRNQLNAYVDLLKEPDVAVYYDKTTNKIFEADPDFAWGPPLLNELSNHFNLKNAPDADTFNGDQGHLIRLRPQR
uniref:hypothetical protein n=1 Tax=uncultured Thiodictyon sp. TaxID=1846217 RepID=UPI0025DE7EF7